jgi:hypothetical protein
MYTKSGWFGSCFGACVYVQLHLHVMFFSKSLVLVVQWVVCADQFFLPRHFTQSFTLTFGLFFNYYYIILMISSVACFAICTLSYSIHQIIYLRGGSTSTTIIATYTLLGFLNICSSTRCLKTLLFVLSINNSKKCLSVILL